MKIINDRLCAKNRMTLLLIGVYLLCKDESSHFRISLAQC